MGGRKGASLLPSRRFCGASVLADTDLLFGTGGGFSLLVIARCGYRISLSWINCSFGGRFQPDYRFHRMYLRNRGLPELVFGGVSGLMPTR